MNIDDNAFKFYYEERANMGYLYFRLLGCWYKIPMYEEGIGDLVFKQTDLYTVRLSHSS